MKTQYLNILYAGEYQDFEFIGMQEHDGEKSYNLFESNKGHKLSERTLEQLLHKQELIEGNRG